MESNIGGTLYDFIYGADGRKIDEYEYSTGYIGGLMSFAYLGGQKIAEYRNGTTYFIFADHLGSARVITGVSGSVTDSYDYMPFGEQFSTGTNTVTDRYAGMDYDTETSIHHTLFRQYPAFQGRWLSPDPLGGDISNPQSLNRYSYVLNNPLTSDDPLGLCTDVNDPNGGLPPYCPVSANDGSDPYGSYGCTLDGISSSCGSINMQDVEQCPSNNCGPRVGNNGYLYQIALTDEGWFYVNPRTDDLFSDGTEFGLLPFDDSADFPGLPASGSSSGGAGSGGGGNNQSCVASSVSQVLAGAQSLNTSQPVGGHLESNFIAPSGDFSSLSGNAFSIFGVNNGYRFGGVFYSLHINGVQPLASVPGYVAFQAHFDVLNPATGLFGMLGHAVVDLGIGSAFFHSSSRLDRACP